MRKHALWVALFLLVPGWSCLLGASQKKSPSAGRNVTVTVTVNRHGPNAPAVLHADDILVYQNKQRRPVVRWVPATGENGGLDLAILIDDSLDPSIGIHYSELKDFVRSLPTGSKVAIAYGMNGNANFAQNFTADHERAAAAIRLPMGRFNQTASIYMAFTNLVKHWPQDGNRREVLVISDGVDLYWGVTEALPSNNPDLQRAVKEAQRQGVTTYAIYAETAGNVRRNPFLVNAGQSCLSLLTKATGGKAYFQGLQTPIDFQSIFRRLTKRLESQYLLTFRTERAAKSSDERLSLTTEQPDVELVAPSRAYVPGDAASAR